MIVMIEKNWYSIINKNNTVIIAYHIKNRIMALISFLFVLFLLLYYRYCLKNEFSVIPVIIYASISLYLFIMSLIIDRYQIIPEKQIIDINKGLFFIQLHRSIYFKDISTVKIDEVKIGKKPHIFYKLFFYYHTNQILKLSFFDKQNKIQMIEKIFIDLINK